MALNFLDLLVILAWLAAVTLFGLRFRSPERTLRAYFLADNAIPWWAIALSIVAAETSTLTVISIPGLAYAQDFRFLQLVFGYLIGRAIVALLFLPAYFRGRMLTAYQLILARFGQRLHALTAAIFLLTRAAAEGVRVFAVAIVVRIALGSLLTGFSNFARDLAAIALVTVLTLLYTFEGGLAAVIWTDVVQLAVYLAGSLFACFTLLHHLPGGLHTVVATAQPLGKFRLFDLSWNLTRSYTLWSGVIGGALLTTASHGTDQLIVQRLLAARSLRQSQLALLASGVAILFQFALFLFLGTALFVFYRVFPVHALFHRSDAIYPTFIVSELPHGISGLLIAAILAAAMANLSAALNSLASTTIFDFYVRLRPNSTESHRLRLARRATLLWGVALFLLALLARGGGRVLEVGLSIASVAYGCLLGVFLLGLLTRSATESAAILGMIAGLALNLYLWLATPVAFPWYVVFGSLATFLVGYCSSRLIPIPDKAHTA
uniref:SSS sodium solute transporter superfamily n=1 Tax=mine drainage metagenome TaxID=410659 RepID=E6QKK1_9ZZZZ